MPTETADSERAAAEAYGRDAWAHGVNIDGARAYSERDQIRQAWRDGWMAAENEQRKLGAGSGYVR